MKKIITIFFLIFTLLSCTNQEIKSDGKILTDYVDNKIPKRTFIVDNNGNAKIGRTYIGIKNSKNIIFFIAKNKNKEEMNKIIKNYGVKKENIIMMDGGPSSQFSYYENNGSGSEFKQFYGKWEVLHFFMIYEK